MSYDRTADFEVRIDTDRLAADVERASNMFSQLGQSAATEGARMESAFANIAKAAGGIFAFSQVKEYIEHIVSIRAEIESLQISFETLLGNKQKANEMFSQIKQFAVRRR